MVGWNFNRYVVTFNFRNDGLKEHSILYFSAQIGLKFHENKKANIAINTL